MIAFIGFHNQKLYSRLGLFIPEWLQGETYFRNKEDRAARRIVRINPTMIQDIKAPLCTLHVPYHDIMQ